MSTQEKRDLLNLLASDPSLRIALKARVSNSKLSNTIAADRTYSALAREHGFPQEKRAQPSFGKKKPPSSPEKLAKERAKRALALQTRLAAEGLSFVDDNYLHCSVCDKTTYKMSPTHRRHYVGCKYRSTPRTFMEKALTRES